MIRKCIPFELKTLTDAGDFSGYGSVFGNKDQQGDIVVQGAFARTLDEWGKKSKLPPVLWQHDQKEPIGTYKTMLEDAKGLFVEGNILINAGPTEKRAYEHMKAGSVNGLSIGYTLFPGGSAYDKAQDATMLKAINLWELSVVTFPANTEALVSEVKTALDGGPKEFERFLRDAGMSRSQAKGLMARGYDGVKTLRDAEDETLDDVVQQMQATLNTMRGMRGSK